MNVVVVSNRVARAKSDEPVAGGLAAALIPMVQGFRRDLGRLERTGRRCDATRDSFAKIEALGTGALATVDMPAKHYRGYYEGFANSALWPALHSRPDLIQVTADDYASYREVNAFMARALVRFNTPEAVFWIQDYHFLTLGRRAAPARHRAAARLLLAHAVGGSPHHGGSAASRRSRQTRCSPTI